ncbi:helix-turn-helix domain-containing protein [Paenibacillus alginolyticus]|uniref:Helix-turn-helix domain-containing protein n=1 Tax=Paenibacillus alginolyticus TaxID=59839 RepID=A0ABT4G8J0_9BACL|nr:helix-turn-helix domain-containing protein [Paenibacillus alginolyticus]MCY9667206.1 helix-turn-helix domain-containing protein [Paenibacillus alginolyticus]MCY9692488.1 helix-turn-helix domain-containing protein [Paenibacillus alginolyticus]MEC0144281.1 helix-turn-helix domain-containing protein [Paenibacillus alginolyticus]
MFRSKRFRNNWILILIITSIPGLISGGLIYWLAGDRLENELLQMHNKQIQLRAANIDEQFSYLEMSVVHWAFDPNFSYSLGSINLSRDFEIGRDITRTLTIMKGSNPLAKQTDLFLEGSAPVRFHPEYESLSDTAQIEGYRQLLAQDKKVFWSQRTPESGSSSDNLTLTIKIPETEQKPFGIIVVQLDTAKVANLLKTLTPYEEGGTFLMQQNGIQLLSSSGKEQESQLDEALKKAVLAKKAKSGSFLFDLNQTTYTVSFGTMTRIGTEWMYVSASPISAITKPVVFISQLILMLSITMLLLAFILSWLASRRIYSPISRLVSLLTGNSAAIALGKEQNDDFKLIEKEWLHLTRESHMLQSKLEQQLPHLKEGFLLQLVQGYLYSYSEQALQERMRNFGWSVGSHHYEVLHIQLSGFENLEGRFSLDDEGLVTFVAANITKELASGRFEQAEVLNFHDLSVGLLIMVPEETEQREAIRAFSQELIEAIHHVLKMSVTITIGSPALSIVHVPSRFEEAMQASSQRRFENRNLIIDLECQDDYDKEHNEIHYPFALEREILQSIRTGQKDESKQLIQAFLEELLERGAKMIDIHQGMLQLLGSILHAIRLSGMDPNRIFKNVNLYEQLVQFGEPQKIIVWIQDKVVGSFMQELESRSDVQVKRTVETAMIYLQNNYMNEISLDSCAMYTGMNTVALSKAFKQVTGKNFIDYLTELRIEKAKELLRDTDMKINDVAEKSGYQPSYFNRIFKKQEGVTPSQYRDFSRK